MHERQVEWHWLQSSVSVTSKYPYLHIHVEFEASFYLKAVALQVMQLVAVSDEQVRQLKWQASHY